MASRRLSLLAWSGIAVCVWLAAAYLWMPRSPSEPSNPPGPVALVSQRPDLPYRLRDSIPATDRLIVVRPLPDGTAGVPVGVILSPEGALCK